MKIAVIAHGLRVAGGLSVGKNFISTLSKVDTCNEYLVIVPSSCGYEQIESGSNIRFYYFKQVSTSKRIKYDLFELKRVIADFNPDVVFSMINSGIRGVEAKQAVLIQDAHMLYETSSYGGETFKGKLKWYIQSKRLRRSLPDVDIVFCQTPVTKKRFSEKFDYPLEKVKLLPNAVTAFKEVNIYELVKPEVFDRAKFSLFYLAKYYAHKNFELIEKLYSNFSDELSDTQTIITVDESHHLKAKKFLDRIRSKGLDKYIINVGALTKDELPAYFHFSSALFFPSLLESFSGTYLEAMHFKTPILTSDIDFAHYICGNSALYFDPYDPVDALNKITKLKNNYHLQKKLIETGNQRIGKFFKSWDEIVSDALAELMNI